MKPVIAYLLRFVCLLMATGAPQVALGDSDFFESKIRPLLADRCVSCHGSDRQDGGIRLDSAEAMVQGGDHGGLIDKGNPKSSRLVLAIRGELSAPDSCEVKAEESEYFVRWISEGLYWPDDALIASAGLSRAEAAKVHWAFQPVTLPTVPDVENGENVRTPVDAFVREKLQDAGLPFSAEADRQTLIRRLSYTLTGLPPSPQAIEEFVNDRDPNAYEKLVDRLLATPAYGEHWARHWLDVARYADTKGYVYGREERFWTHSWAYRDWVVNALNEDIPYDQFLLLQMAADQVVEDPADKDLAAMGFLTLGRRFLGVERDIIDDRIDVVTRGTMGLTVGCARCHDHKYDPIPTADYYSLYGVFASSEEDLRATGDPDVESDAFRAELKKRKETLATTMAKLRLESAKRTRERTADYLFAQTELEKYPDDGFGQIFSKTDLLPAFVYRWEEFLREAEKRKDPIFVPWHTYRTLSPKGFSEAASKIKFDDGSVHPIVARAFQKPPLSMREVADRYGEIFGKVDGPEKLPDPDAESLRQVLYDPDSPAEAPQLPIVHSETFYPNGVITQLWKLEGEIARWINDSKSGYPHALILKDRKDPVNPRIFVRGDPLKKGDHVPRQFLSLLAGDQRESFGKGSGRLEMAKAIIDSANPLTARVMVNRVWMHHFGEGLVSTPSDFGLRATPPSHPELLDWLTAQFVAEGWSLKKLHRHIVLSSAFRQRSSGPEDASARKLAMEIDPQNRLLWRMNSRRLSWEQFRDSLLAASGELNLQIGGKPVDLLGADASKRRTLYGLVDRQFLPGVLRTFDFASPDLHTPKRSQTTVPQQALFFMNHPLVLDSARSLAKLSERKATSPVERIGILFQQIWQRNPSAAETAEALELIEAVGQAGKELGPSTSEEWQYGYGSFDEKEERVVGFTPLPHFNGEAWQGGGKWPDSKLGWVQLTAQGGHPGNDRRHASIRRWTAPRKMVIEIDSKLIHEPKPGDGIRAFIVSSRVGKLASATIHQKTVDLNLESLEVEEGETIDFLVDIDKILNSDQYLWRATIFDSPDGETSVTWESQNDFSATRESKLTAWEQLAQTLLCSNEFLFID